MSTSARGLGVGRRLLDEVEGTARDAGVRTLRLETNRTLVEAIGLYRSAGFVQVPAFNDEPFAHHWFEKQLLRPLRLSRPLPGRSCVLTTSLRAQPPPNSAVLGRVGRIAR